jgi:hypothetical protein
VNLFEPHTARPLGAARIVFGVAAMLKGWNMREVFGPLVGPEPLHMPYWAVLPSPGPVLAFVLVLVWIAAAAVFTVGWRTRWAGSVLTLTVGVSFVLDQQTYSNHLYLLLITSLLLTVTDSGSAYALDSRRTGGRSTVEAWQPLVLRAQLTIVYGFAAYARASGHRDALRHALDLHGVVNERLHDGKHGGWHEYATRDWSVLPAGDTRAVVEPAGVKSANTHLHWLEALT